MSSQLPTGLSNPHQHEIDYWEKQKQMQEQNQQQQQQQKQRQTKLQKSKSSNNVQNGTVIVKKIDENRMRQEETKEELGATSVEYAIFAFYDSEKEYVKILTNLANEQKRLVLQARIGRNAPFQNEKDIHHVFGTLQNIEKTSVSFLDNMTKLLVKGLSDKLGKEVEKMVPYLKMYGVYVDDIKGNLTHLQKLSEKNKRVREYQEIIKELYGKSLETMLQEPMKRLPFYLQLLANIYAAYVEKQQQNSEGGKCLYGALVAIKKLIDDIAQKTRDKKARMFCAVLQKNLFKNKVKLSEPYRMVYRTGKIKFLRHQGKKVENGFLILCNDIILITAHPKKGAKLHGILPTYNSRVIKDVKIPKNIKVPPDHQGKFVLMCQNKAYNTDKTDLLYLIIFVKDDKQSAIWVQAIDSAIDEEEHNLHPTNPVDLEKRLCMKETSLAGKAAQLDIKDPEMIQQIQRWRKDRDERGIIGRRGFITKYAPVEHEKQQQLKRQKTAPSLSVNNQSQQQQGSQPGGPPPMSKSKTESNLMKSNGPPKFNGGPPPGPPGPPKFNGGPPPGPPKMGGPPGPPKFNNGGPHGPPKFNSGPPPGPPKMGGPPPPPNMKSGGPPGPPKFTVGPPPPRMGGPPPGPPGPPKMNSKPKQPRRNNLLSSIQGFNKNKLNVAPENSRGRGKSVQQDMQDILKDTLQGYRKFVMDEKDDESDNDDDEWMDD